MLDGRPEILSRGVMLLTRASTIFANMSQPCYQRCLLLALVGLALAYPARGQMPDSVLVGSCQSPNAQVFLEPGNVRARILNDGSLFLGAGGSDVGYEVPKGSGKHAIYTSNLWIAGYVSHELRAAAGTFFVQEYWPGPIDSEGRPPTDCVEYDHVWSVTLDDLEQHASGSATSTDIADWPADLGAP